MQDKERRVVMDRQSIERQLISYCEGARMITADELKGFLRPGGKIGNHAIAYYLQGVGFVRTGKGGVKNYFIPDWRVGERT